MKPVCECSKKILGHLLVFKMIARVRNNSAKVIFKKSLQHFQTPDDLSKRDRETLHSVRNCPTRCTNLSLSVPKVHCLLLAVSSVLKTAVRARSTQHLAICASKIRAVQCRPEILPDKPYIRRKCILVFENVEFFRSIFPRCDGSAALRFWEPAAAPHSSAASSTGTAP